MKPPMSGPAIIAAGITAIITPWYLPRSRGGTSIPMIDMTPTIRPPAPRPWMPRKSTSWAMSWLVPHSAEPSRNNAIEARKVRLRPKMSPSLPQIGVAIVVARM